MELDIHELSITIIVGAFTILGLEAIFYYFFNKQFTGFFQDKFGLKRAKPTETSKNGKIRDNDTQDKEETHIHSMKAVVFIGMAFGIGILAEDLSYKFVDNVQTPFKTLPAALSSALPEELNDRLGLPSKESSRIRTLIKNLNDNPRIQPLAIDLAKNTAFSQLDPNIGGKVESWITCKSGTKSGDECSVVNREPPSEQEITSSIYSLYYYAKNNVYTIPQYYDELKKIESRRDFSRSISLIAYIYLIIAILLGLLRITLLFRKSKMNKNEKDQRKEMFVKIASVWLVLFCIYFFSMWAYEREADEFNKRAFGYYSSMLFMNKHKANGNTGEVTGTPAPSNSFNPTP